MSNDGYDTVVLHDSSRCPNCDSHGTIDDVTTSSTAPNTQSRVKSRTYDCWECDTEWKEYV